MLSLQKHSHQPNYGCNVLILMNNMLMLQNADERHFAGRRPVTDMEVYDDT